MPAKTPLDISLYGILDPQHCRGRDLAGLAELAAKNGVTLLQYRDKINEFDQMLTNVRKIQQALEGCNVPLIINDHVALAAQSNAEGIHLGQEDCPIDEARSKLRTDAIIGLSVKTEAQARAVPITLLDYVFVGGVFDTTSKDNPTAIGIAGWQRLATIIRSQGPNLPVGAIAGINAQNIETLFEAGVDGVAIISALFECEDVAAASLSFVQQIEAARSRTNTPDKPGET